MAAVKKSKKVIKEIIAEAVIAPEVVEQLVEVPEAKVAKAGKRSAKSLEAAEAKLAKEERKADESHDADKPKTPAPKIRSRLERRGKNFKKVASLIETGKLYTIAEAVDLATKTSTTKFDSTVELHVNLNVDPKYADQNIRDNLQLPAGTGKTVRVAVLTDDVAEAMKAGADIAGTDELLNLLDTGTINFDVLISSPNQMAKLGKYARILGPRGLMPNPKSGTVTSNISKAIAESKAGRVEYRVDTTGIVHLGVGKASFTQVQLLENLNAIMTSIKSNKPSSIKNAYIKSVHLTTSMGPSIAVDLASIL
jgi:large subunit ribosomal protein L1